MLSPDFGSSDGLRWTSCGDSNRHCYYCELISRRTFQPVMSLTIGPSRMGLTCLLVLLRKVESLYIVLSLMLSCLVMYISLCQTWSSPTVWWRTFNSHSYRHLIQNSTPVSLMHYSGCIGNTNIMGIFLVPQLEGSLSRKSSYCCSWMASHFS